MNHLLMNRGLEPSLRSLILAGRIEILDEQILDIGIEIRKAPGDPLVVTDYYKGQPGQAKTRNIIISAMELYFKPNPGNLMSEVHVIAQKRFSGRRVCARNHPIVRSW